MNHRKRRDPPALLVEAVGDLRIIGGLFCLLSVVPLFFGLASRAPQLVGQMLAAVDSVLLLGPGVWYLIAANSFKRRNFSLIRPTLYVAGGQLAIVFGILGLGMLLRLGSIAALVVPAVMVMFFIPAVAATMWHIRRLEQMAHLLLPTGMAFEPIAVQPIPVAEVMEEKDANEAR
jgi:hypothetical protein